MGEPQVLTTSTWTQKSKGFVFSMTMLFSAFFGSIYVLMPLMPLIILRPTLFRRLVDRLVGFWLVLPSVIHPCLYWPNQPFKGLMEYLFGIKLFVTGDVIDYAQPALIIMNHRTRLDWLFFWNALFRIDPWLMTSEKISLKGILKYLPGAGWAMQTNAYMFLDRTFTLDQSRIDKLIDYYADNNNYQLLLYPEGTDKCPLATARSKKFAEKNDLVHFDYVLHPRTTGFTHILQKMRKVNYVDYVYDVTVAYGDAIVQSEVDLVTLGVCPRNIHFDIRKINIGDLPNTDEKLNEWLKKLWIEKEERLRKFYAQAQDTRRLDTRPDALTFEHTLHTQFMQFGIVAVWTLLTASWVYFYFCYPYQGMAALLTIFFYVGSQYFFGGLEILLAKQAKQWSIEKKKKLID
jgi:lysocardiolipin and lysophospholipid acyltransferase